MIKLIKNRAEWNEVEWLDFLENNPKPTLTKFPVIYYTETEEYDSFHGGGYSTESYGVSRVHKFPKQFLTEFSSSRTAALAAYFIGFKAGMEKS